MAKGVDEDVFEQLVETVGRFARERLIPTERRVEEEDAIPASPAAAAAPQTGALKIVMRRR